MADQLRGGLGNDAYVVRDAVDVVTEASGAGTGTDTIVSFINIGALAANVENLTLHTIGGAINGTGNSLANVIVGNADANRLNGGTGLDTLTGGGGDDTFLFNTALNATTNVDMITDFDAADDLIHLENAIFTTLAAGALSAGAFVEGGAATLATHRIIFNSGTGDLFYDANGSGAGGQIKFAHFDNLSAPLTFEDFFIV